MQISKVYAVYYSATGNTAKVVSRMATHLAEQCGVSVQTVDFTLPGARSAVHSFREGDLVVFGTPVYAGRVPNKMLPSVQTLFQGNGALAIPVAVFGNRNFDNALIELRDELEKNGFHTIAGAGVATSHVFSTQIAPGRPDQADLELLDQFVVQVAHKLALLEQIPAPVSVRGDEPIGPYYTPLGSDGKPAMFLKAKPVTDRDACTNCGICVVSCPMGSINPDDPADICGPCIKCQACVLKCPVQAKYFDDPAFLSHVAMLEQHYAKRSEPEFFL